MIGGASLLAVRNRIRAQQRQDAGRVVGAQNVQTAVEGGRGVVLPLLLHGVPEVRRVAAPEIVQRRRPQGIVHQAVGLPTQQVLAAAGVGDLVAAVLPHLAQQKAVGLFLLHGGANFLNKVVWQLVGHVQPPAVRAAPQPAADHAVLSPDDEVPIGRGVFVDGGQRVDAPPGVVLVRPVLETEPVVPRGFLALVRAGGVEKAAPVEVPAVVAGVVEHAVQHHVDATLFRLGAQHPQVALRAQHGVDHAVVRRVVPVAAGGVENGVQVQGGDGQALQVVQLPADAPQAAAEKIAVPATRQGIGPQSGRVVPVVVYRPLAQQSLGVGDGVTAEAVWKNLVCNAPAEPLRRGAAFVYRQLPGLAGSLLSQTVAAQIDAAAVRPGEAEAVPHQLRLFRRGEHTGKAARTGEKS